MSAWQRDRAGQYKLGRRLRSEPSGTVYKARDALTRARVTVTELAPELVADARFLTRFRHEMGDLSQLDHPNCGRVLDFLEIDGRVYVVSERIEGRTLREVIGSATLRPQQALALLRGILVGLDAAHSVRLLHRSLRPESVVLQADGLVKLTGFGQPAYGAGAGARAALFAGISPYAYMAPEQIVGAEADVRTDVYLAGVLGFELLAGRPPFTSLDPAEVWSMHMSQDPPRLVELRPDVIAPVADIVIQALAKVPDHRQQSAQEFIGQIDAVGSPSGVVWTEPAPFDRLARVGVLTAGLTATAENPTGSASARGRLTWRPLRALVPGVAALALALSAAADGTNPNWGVRSGTRARQAASNIQGPNQRSQAQGPRLPGAPPDAMLTPPGPDLASPAAALAAARIPLPAVTVSPILLSAAEPTPPPPVAAPPATQPSPPGTPAPAPAPSSSPSPPTADPELDPPEAEEATEEPETEAAEALAEADTIAEDLADAEPADPH